MFRFLFQLIIFATIAWLLSPILEVLIPLPTENMVSGILNLTNKFDHTTFMVMRYTVWIVLLWFLYKYTIPLFNIVAPAYRSYSNTKFVRSIQGVWTELCLLLLTFLIVAGVMASIRYAWMFWKAEELYEKSMDFHYHSADDIFEEERNEIKSKATRDLLNKMEINRNNALSLIQKNTKWQNKNIAALFWPQKSVNGTIVPIEDFPETPENFLYNYNGTLSLTKASSYRVPFFNGYDFATYTFYYNKQKQLYAEKQSIADGTYTNEDLALLNTVIDSVVNMHGSKEQYWKSIHDKTLWFHVYIDSTNQGFRESLGDYNNYFEFPKSNNKVAYLNFFEWKDKPRAQIKLFVWNYKKIRFWALLVALVLYIGSFYDRQNSSSFLIRLTDFFEKGRFGRGGSARFAGIFEEWGSLHKNQRYGLFMGRSLYNPLFDIGLEDDRHMMTIAASRSGKGTSVIIPNLLLWKGSTLVIDPKGTNAAVTKTHREIMGQKVHVIDPFNILRAGNRARLNPLDMIDVNAPDAREKINIITEALIVRDPNTKERYWDDSAQSVLAGLIAHLMTSPKYEKPSLAMVRDLITIPNAEFDELLLDMAMNDGAGGLAKDAAYRLLRGGGTNEIKSILSSLDRHTEWLSSPAMVDTLSRSTFDLKDLKEKPTSVFLIIPPEYLNTHNRFLRLFVNLMVTQMSIGGRSKTPILLLLDEFLALGRMEEIEKAYGLMASYNITLWPFIQDLGRLRDLYDKSVNAFIANSRAVQVFGAVDDETKEFISKKIGTRLYTPKTKTGSGTTSRVPLVDTTEVEKDIKAKSKRQYVLRAGYAPMILEKVNYYEAKKFRGKYSKDPDYE
ncbi:MAG: hypothetical protein BM557_06230 [Flavobacterium sp. MedPE-SWcel]|uniref:type IV secretory system conjugative DNA transfer family protein n=1 Tax=uncultured Flavobacterium sp. TaxID=165435 RepID=UPI00091374B0|nr:type IV secretory system conjugative DNA transfer family protein [uncultured Flavobacterium sp.]OIQ19299.1 MAG: hypothetical protein BM557_06230 [Flavobacterium sp. MedPE-SWcel]